MGVMDFFDETKYAICGTGYISKENRKNFLWTLFSTAKNKGIGKSEGKSSLSKIEKEILGDVKRIPKDKRDFVIKITKQDIIDAFFGVYGIDVVESRPIEKKAKEVVVEENYEIDFSNVLDDEYAKRKGIAQGPTMDELLDRDFCAKLGIK